MYEPRNSESFFEFVPAEYLARSYNVYVDLKPVTKGSTLLTFSKANTARVRISILSTVLL